MERKESFCGASDLNGPYNLDERPDLIPVFLETGLLHGLFERDNVLPNKYYVVLTPWVRFTYDDGDLWYEDDDESFLVKETNFSISDSSIGYEVKPYTTGRIFDRKILDKEIQIRQLRKSLTEEELAAITSEIELLRKEIESACTKYYQLANKHKTTLEKIKVTKDLCWDINEELFAAKSASNSLLQVFLEE